MEKRLKGRLIKVLRREHLYHKPAKIAKDKCKIGPALYECQKCGITIYEGNSKKTFEKLKKEYDKIIHGKGDIDHIEPVVNPFDGFCGWDDFIESLFGEEEDYQYLCKECHKKKTQEENSRR